MASGLHCDCAGARAAETGKRARAEKEAKQERARAKKQVAEDKRREAAAKAAAKRHIVLSVALPCSVGMAFVLVLVAVRLWMCRPKKPVILIMSCPEARL